MSGHNYGEIPRFVEELAYLRGLNVGITIGLQSLSQLKKKYKDSWESIFGEFCKREFRVYGIFAW